MSDPLTNLATHIIIPAALIWAAAWTVCRVIEWHRADQAAALAAERAARQERIAEFERTTKARFEAQMQQRRPGTVARMERIRQQIAENETRRFIEAWDRGEVQP